MTGRGRVLAQLAREMPPVTLLVGRDSQALWQLAVEAVPFGSLIHAVFRLDAEAAREVARDVFTASSGERAYFLVNLDGSSEQAQNILLKVLEEPPPPARFLLVASSMPLPTLASRAHVHKVEGELELLVVSSQEAEEGSKARTAVGTALKASMTGDDELLAAAVRGWEPVYSVYLTRWALEASSGRWVMFSADTAPGATMAQARKLLECLGAFGAAKHGPGVAFDQAFREEPG